MFTFQDSIEAMHQAAREALGLEDFGCDDYSEALQVLCRSLDEDARLSEAGVLAFQGMIVDALSARLRVEEGWKRYPEAARARIERPLVIVGLPRTGTTALHHLLAQDPDLQAFEHWLQRTPKPRPPRAEWEADPDYQAAAARMAMVYAQSPELRAIHETEADLPDECWNVFAQNFANSSWQANADVDGYAAWWADFDMTPVYARHRRTAQIVGAHEPERRWLFKDATHLFSLDALLGAYPEARIVQTHRDPVEVIPSVCSLCQAVRAPLNREMDPARFGEATLSLWERSIANMMRAREGRDPSQFFDLRFEDFVADPMAAIERIYAAFGLEFTAEARAAMTRFRAANPKGKHGAHAYSAEEWGLDARQIGERFEAYGRAFDLGGAAHSS